MAGLAFLLHFGAFHLLSCAWRAAGVDARPLMDWPARSASLAEVWGRRWNTAFRDLAHRFLFRPLAGRLGPRAGLAAGFLFSGLVHDLVISVPAGAGYGWPTLYFAAQGLGLLAERSRAGRSVGLGAGWRGRAFTALVVAGPAYGLFHPPFVSNVVLPFLDVVGAV
jgi:alginate O-acetyltransferase complex protein AlgI